MNTPEALRIADNLMELIDLHAWAYTVRDEAAAELRRLHEQNQKLLGALKEISEVDYCNDGESFLYLAQAAIAEVEGKI